MLMVEIPKPHSHPLLSSIHTTSVTAIRPPQAREKTKKLKKVDLCFLPCGVPSSNCSAPCVANDPFIPPTPSATMYRPMNSSPALPPLTSWHGLLGLPGVHFGGFSEGKRACTVSMIKPCNKKLTGPLETTLIHKYTTKLHGNIFLCPFLVGIN